MDTSTRVPLRFSQNVRTDIEPSTVVITDEKLSDEHLRQVYDRLGLDDDARKELAEKIRKYIDTNVEKDVELASDSYHLLAKLIICLINELALLESVNTA